MRMKTALLSVLTFGALLFGTSVSAASIPASGVSNGFKFDHRPDGSLEILRCENICPATVTVPQRLTKTGNQDVTAIGGSAFNADSGTTLMTTKVNLPSTITYIGARAFEGSKLEKFVAPRDLYQIDWQAFAGSAKLKSVSLNSKLEIIQDRAFANLGSLTSLTIPDSVSYLGDGVLSWGVLKSLRLPSNLYDFKPSMVRGQSQLESITMGRPAAAVSVEGNAVYTQHGTTLAYVAPQFAGTVRVPEGVTTVGNSALYGSAVTSVVLPASLTTIEPLGIAACSNLSLTFNGAPPLVKTEANMINFCASSHTSVSHVSHPSPNWYVTSKTRGIPRPLDITPPQGGWPIQIISNVSLKSFKAVVKKVSTGSGFGKFRFDAYVTSSDYFYSEDSKAVTYKWVECTQAFDEYDGEHVPDGCVVVDGATKSKLSIDISHAGKYIFAITTATTSARSRSVSGPTVKLGP